MTSPHGKGVGEQVHLAITLLATVAISMGICNGAPSTAHSSLFLFFSLMLRLIFLAIRPMSRSEV